jgi:hypothetical protein
MMEKKFQNDQEANRWNHRPDGAVPLNPLFNWPPSLLPVLKWYSNYWLAASTTTLAIALAFTAYFII